MLYLILLEAIQLLEPSNKIMMHQHQLSCDQQNYQVRTSFTCFYCASDEVYHWKSCLKSLVWVFQWLGNYLMLLRMICWTFKSWEEDMFVSAEQQKKQLACSARWSVILSWDFIQFRTSRETYSKYKGQNVMLFSVGIACNGATIFCSEGMEGRMSEKEIILNSGLLDFV